MIAKEYYAQGYKLANGHKWQNGLNPYDSKIDGRYTVVLDTENEDDQEIVARLSFKDLKLNGEAIFYEGKPKERFVYENNRLHGWGVIIEYSEESTRLYYEKGVLKRKLIRDISLDGFWREVDVISNELIGYFVLDSENQRIDIGYCYSEGVIEGVYLFDRDRKHLCLKSMRGGIMKEYDERGNLVYEGAFKDSVKEGFPRIEAKDDLISERTAPYRDEEGLICGGLILVEEPVDDESLSPVHSWKDMFPEDSELRVSKVNGMKEGEGKVLSSYGVPLASLMFEKDEIHGPCYFMNEFGETEYFYTYYHGKRHGWFCQYHLGQVIKRGLYEEDKEVSELRAHSKDPSFMEEVRDGKVVRICKFNNKHHRDGLCACFDNNVVESVVRYEDGAKKEVVYKFQKDRMTQYDKENRIVYRGGFSGDILEGYSYNGQGFCYTYLEDEIQIEKFSNGKRILYQIRRDNLQEYSDSGDLIYEGECKGSISTGFIREGYGKEFVSNNEIRYCLFKEGKVEKCLKRFKDDIMTEYDDDNNIVYIGEFSEDYSRTGKGRSYTYNGSAVKEIKEWNEQNEVVKTVLFEELVMKEFWKTGTRLYIGGYKGSAEEGFVRDGEGYEFYENGMPVYYGDWKNGMREGKGCYYKDKMLRFSGFWEHGKPNGQGKWIENNDIKYKGEWKDGRINLEEGISFDYLSESIIEKKEEEPVISEIESMVNQDEFSFYEGNLKDGCPHGYGRMIDEEKETVIEGEWDEGVLRIGKQYWIEKQGDEYMICKKRSGCGREKRETWGNQDIRIQEEMDWNQLSMWICRIVVAENSCNELKSQLKICNFPCLQRLIIARNSLKNLKSLTICKCNELKWVLVESDSSDNEDAPLSYVKHVTIKGKTLRLSVNKTFLN